MCLEITLWSELSLLPITGVESYALLHDFPCSLASLTVRGESCILTAGASFPQTFRKHPSFTSLYTCWQFLQWISGFLTTLQNWWQFSRGVWKISWPWSCLHQYSQLINWAVILILPYRAGDLVVVLIMAIQGTNWSHIHYRISVFAAICCSPSLPSVGEEGLTRSRTVQVLGERLCRKQRGLNAELDTWESLWTFIILKGFKYKMEVLLFGD